ncbi:hypothetical protein KBC31_03300 [Candidatus Saccharibacteria bacterium]|jgi:hypothetical protein|nr:hypothetical protein [Candidatus Saccharibacteria bacterium]
MFKNDAFIKILQIKPVFETEEYFCSQSIWEFAYKYQSLNRHWNLSKEFFTNYVSDLKSTNLPDSAELNDAYSETADVDVEHFPEYIRQSTLAIALSLLENMLNGLSLEIAEDQGIDVDLPDKNIPYINKYILWFAQGCGIEIDINKSIWKSLDAIRTVRNRFIHQIDRDIPDQVQKVISEMAASSVDSKHLVNDEFVDVSLKKLAEIAKNVELAHISYFQNQHGK